MPVTAAIRKQRWPKILQGVDRSKGKAFILVLESLFEWRKGKTLCIQVFPKKGVFMKKV